MKSLWSRHFDKNMQVDEVSGFYPDHCEAVGREMRFHKKDEENI